MKVSVFGLGYVGTVSAGCLAHDGHEVVGVDPVATKIELINRGQSPIIEADIGEMIASNAPATGWGDDDGVMVLPKAQAVELANRAMDVLEKENRLRGEIDGGKTLSEVAYLQKWEKR